MIKTAYICDRCKHEQEKPEQMWNVAVLAEHFPDTPRANTYDAFISAQLWCRKCCEEMKIYPIVSRKKEEEPLPPTLEDQIREIVRDEVENHQ